MGKQQSSHANKFDVHELMEKLRRERDEINLKMHLAQAEARDEWAELEKKWEHFKTKTASVSKEASVAGGDIGAATKVLGEELKHGYERIKKAIS